MLDVELGGQTPGTEFDRINVSGNVALAGALHIALLAGYHPNGGEQYTIMTSSGPISGAFSSIEGAGSYSVAYNANNVVLTLDVPPVLGDVNNDGLVNIDDLFGVIAAWGACPLPPVACPADLDNDGHVDIDDLFTVIANWS